MCGSFTLRTPAGELAGLLTDLHGPELARPEPKLFRPRFNIAPTQSVLVIRPAFHGIGGKGCEAVAMGADPQLVEVPHRPAALQRPVGDGGREAIVPHGVSSAWRLDPCRRVL